LRNAWETESGLAFERIWRGKGSSKFFENAKSVENITVRYENAVEDVISEF
jgi:hypothetical protein